MREHGNRRRVRIITDEVKYRRHRRKKLLRKVLSWAGWILVFTAGVLLLWLALDRMMQPPPQE